MVKYLRHALSSVELLNVLSRLVQLIEIMNEAISSRLSEPFEIQGDICIDLETCQLLRDDVTLIRLLYARLTVHANK